MNKFEIKLKYVHSLCEQKKVKLTEKRQQVLYSLLKANKALSAYELIDSLRVHFDQDFAPMTVYRILKVSRGTCFSPQIAIYISS